MNRKSLENLDTSSNIHREIRKQSAVCYINQKLNFHKHLHDEIEIFYLIKGDGLAYCDGQQYELHEGMIFCAFPNQLHSFSNFGEKDSCYVLIFKPSLLLHHADSIEEIYPLNNTYMPDEIESKKLKAIFEIFLMELSNKNHPIGDELISTYLTLIFEKIFEHFTLQTRRADIMSKIIHYCINNSDQPLTLSFISEKFNLSQSHLSRLFNSRLNMHFCNYINSLRISKAQTLLKTSSLSITEIANIVGFSNLRSFNLSFSKMLGTTPSQYRKDNQKQL